jgi:hypothetical protein
MKEISATTCKPSDNALIEAFSAQILIAVWNIESLTLVYRV